MDGNPYAYQPLFSERVQQARVAQQKLVPGGDFNGMAQFMEDAQTGAREPRARLMGPEGIHRHGSHVGWLQAQCRKRLRSLEQVGAQELRSIPLCEDLSSNAAVGHEQAV